MQGRLTLHVRRLVHISQVSGVFLKESMSVQLHRYTHEIINYLVGTESVFSGVGDIFHGTDLIIGFCSVGLSLAKLIIYSRERCGDYLIHIVVLILSEPAAEDYIGTGSGEGLVLFVKSIVCFVVYRIVRLNARLPFG